MRRAGPAILVLAALATAGCGTDAQPAREAREPATVPSPSPTVRSESPPVPAATASPAAAATSSATPPVATAPSAPPPPSGAEQGDAADEVARTPVRVVVDAEGITPPSSTVPAFLAVRLTVRNDLPRAIRVSLGDAAGTVRARGRQTFDVGGLQRGPHPIDAGRAGRATVVAE